MSQAVEHVVPSGQTNLLSRYPSTYVHLRAGLVPAVPLGQKYATSKLAPRACISLLSLCRIPPCFNKPDTVVIRWISIHRMDVVHWNSA